MTLLGCSSMPFSSFSLVKKNAFAKEISSSKIELLFGGSILSCRGISFRGSLLGFAEPEHDKNENSYSS